MADVERDALDGVDAVRGAAEEAATEVEADGELAQGDDGGQARGLGG